MVAGVAAVEQQSGVIGGGPAVCRTVAGGHAEGERGFEMADRDIIVAARVCEEPEQVVEAQRGRKGMVPACGAMAP